MSISIFSPKEIIKNIKTTLIRFPLTMFAVVVATLTSVYFINHVGYASSFDLILLKLQYVSILASTLFASIEIIKSSLGNRNRFLLFAAAILMLIAYYFTLPSTRHLMYSFESVFKEFLLTIMFFIAILWSPFLFTKEENKDYWQYAKTILVTFAFTAFFSLIMLLGANLALMMIHKLFHIHINGKLYPEIDIIIIGIFGSGFFLSQLPKEPTAIKFLGKTPIVELFFTKYILTPLTIIYFLILYAYSFKILITQQWPQSMLAWTIVAFSIIAVLTYLFWSHHTNNISSKFRKALWTAIGLQTIMLFVSVGMRISNYSWTQSRYMVVMFGVWLLINSIYFLLFKNAKLKMIFITLSTFIAISQIGPFSAYTISLNAQSSRLKSSLAELKKYPDTQKAPDDLKFQISNNIHYLSRNYGIESLKPIIPKIVTKYKKENSEKDRSYYKFDKFATKELGFEYMYRNHSSYYEDKSITFNSNSPYRKYIYKITGYDYIINATSYTTSKGNISTTLEANILLINSGINQIKFDLDKIMETLSSKKSKTTNNTTLPIESMTFTQENTKLKAKVIFKYIRLNKNNNHSYTLDAIILLKVK